MIQRTLESHKLEKFPIGAELHYQVDPVLPLNDFFNSNNILVTKSLANFHLIFNGFVVEFSKVDYLGSKLFASLYMKCLMNSPISPTANLFANTVVSNNKSFLISSLFNVNETSLLMGSFWFIFELLHYANKYKEC